MENKKERKTEQSTLILIFAIIFLLIPAMPIFILYFFLVLLLVYSFNKKYSRSLIRRWCNTFPSTFHHLFIYIVFTLAVLLAVFLVIPYYAITECNGITMILILSIGYPSFFVFLLVNLHKKNSEDNKKSYYFDDTPLNPNKDNENLLEKNKVLKSLILNIESRYGVDSYYSISLNGKWGIGKTSILKYLEYKMQSKNEILWINLWELKEPTDAMHELEEQMQEFFKKVYITSFAKYTKFFRLASGVFASPIIDALSNIPFIDEDKSMRTARKNLNKKISEALHLSNKKKLIIIFDDIDRVLEKNEVLIALKVIRSIARYDNVITITGIDLSQTIGILNENGKDNYADFVYKIFTNNVDFAESINQSEIVTYLREEIFPKEKDGLKLSLFYEKNKISEKDRENIKNNVINGIIYSEHIHRVFSTYRELKLTMNEFFSKLSIMKRGIDERNKKISEKNKGKHKSEQKEEISISDMIDFDIVFVLSAIKNLNISFYNALIKNISSALNHDAENMKNIFLVILYTAKDYLYTKTDYNFQRFETLLIGADVTDHSHEGNPEQLKKQGCILKNSSIGIINALKVLGINITEKMLIGLDDQKKQDESENSYFENLTKELSSISFEFYLYPFLLDYYFTTIELKNHFDEIRNLQPQSNIETKINEFICTKIKSSDEFAEFEKMKIITQYLKHIKENFRLVPKDKMEMVTKAIFIGCSSILIEKENTISSYIYIKDIADSIFSLFNFRKTRRSRHYIAFIEYAKDDNIIAMAINLALINLIFSEQVVTKIIQSQRFVSNSAILNALISNMQKFISKRKNKLPLLFIEFLLEFIKEELNNFHYPIDSGKTDNEKSAIEDSFIKSFKDLFKLFDIIDLKQVQDLKVENREEMTEKIIRSISEMISLDRPNLNSIFTILLDEQNQNYISLFIIQLFEIEYIFNSQIIISCINNIAKFLIFASLRYKRLKKGIHPITDWTKIDGYINLLKFIKSKENYFNDNKFKPEIEGATPEMTFDDLLKYLENFKNGK